MLWIIASLVIFGIDRLDLDGSPLDGSAADWIGVALGLTGVGLAAAGGRRFVAAGTTTDPNRPDKASTLVTGGIYRFTRNPMYLGLVLLSAGWALRLGSLVGLLIGSGGLVAALTWLQIRPEERILGQTFGAEYHDYRSRVRRWL